MYVVAGVSGNTGAVVAGALLDQKKPVRVLVRDAQKGAPWASRGAEVATATLDDEQALVKALAGAKGLYLLSPPNPASADFLAERKKTMDTVVRAVAAAKVPHVVLLSSIAAHLAEGTGIVRTVHYAEQVLKGVTALTAVRPGYFMENWGASLGTVKEGKLFTFLKPDLSIPMIATRDIGKVAATALLEGPRGYDVIELAGPREYSSIDVAKEISKIIGADVQAIGAPEEAVVPTFTGFGISANIAELYRQMYHGLNTGVVRWEGKRLVRGETPLEGVLRPMLTQS